MGKNKLIKSLGKRIGNIVIHKILMKYTNKPESFKIIDNRWPNYLLFDMNIHFGINFR